MRKLFISILLAALCAACSKSDGPAAPATNNFANEKDKTNAWLEMQKQKAGKDGAARITALQQNLDFASLIQPAFGADEYLYIIPIKEAFGSKNNAERNPVNQLVLFINKETNTIRKGNIVQFIQSAPAGRQELNGFFTDYYAFRDHTFTGSLAYNTVADEMLYEVNYRDGKHNYYKSINKKQLTGGRNATCFEIGWYYFWADGTVTWEPVGEYCDGCEPVKVFQGKTYRVNCAGGGGGGGGGEEPSPTRWVSWEVYRENMYAEPIKIIADAQLWGVKVAGEPQGGHFYKSIDQGCYTENFSTYGAELENSYTQTWHGTQNAYQSFQGTINYHSSGVDNKYVANTRTFLFAEVFP